MSVLSARGGYPFVRRLAPDATTGVKVDLPQRSMWIEARAATATVKMYFSLADFTANANYVIIPLAAAANPDGRWAGPIAVDAIWFLSSSGTAAVELLACLMVGG